MRPAHRGSQTTAPAPRQQYARRQGRPINHIELTHTASRPRAGVGACDSSDGPPRRGSGGRGAAGAGDPFTAAPWCSRTVVAELLSRLCSRARPDRAGRDSLSYSELLE